MASTSALLTGLSGLIANSRKLDVIGNNIANANTTAYKSNRMLFAPTFSRTLSSGTGPSGALGGTNPSQVGLGVSIAGTQRNFSNGAIAATGVSTDLAIEGSGFFVVNRSGQDFFTRAGAFQLNAQRDLVTIDGARVQGFGVDDNFNIVSGTRTNLNIPLGSLTIAEATRAVDFAGNLNAAGDLPTQGANVGIDQPFETTGGAPLTGASLLTTLANPDAPATTLFDAGMVPYTWTLSGAQKGEKTMPARTLEIDAATTVDDLLNFINNTLGIQAGLTNPDGSITGAQIDAMGVVSIVGNIGEANDLAIDNTDIVLRDMNGDVVTNPFTTTQSAQADGESVRTSFVVYDSLGASMDVDITMVIDSTGPLGTTWRYFVESPDNVDSANLSRALSTGTLDFDTSGRLATTTPITVQLGRENTGAVHPLVFDIVLDSGADTVTALADPLGESAIASVFQNGSPLGVLSTFSVGENGRITGGFTNGLTRTIGQIALATFTNPEGLVDAGGNMFTVGPNSGTPLITTPGDFGSGRIIGGSLEQSNVDLGQEFIDLVLTSTGYSASSRVISTTDQLLQQLLALGR
ncbi:MAG: flagellar hook-basal body complex protein [Phycisphaerales bacterium]|nr:MAG: flagellar hook-basal body complex protein [Phycisphaerales bacterium]